LSRITNKKKHLAATDEDMTSFEGIKSNNKIPVHQVTKSKAVRKERSDRTTF